MWAKQDSEKPGHIKSGQHCFGRKGARKKRGSQIGEGVGLIGTCQKTALDIISFGISYF